MVNSEPSQTVPIDICFLSCLHRWDDTRVFHREATGLAAAGYSIVHLAPAAHGEAVGSFVDRGVLVRTYASGHGRAGTILTLMREALRTPARAYHCNEVDSWLVGCALRLSGRRSRIVFDVHEHYLTRFRERHWSVALPGVAGWLLARLFRLLTYFTDHFVFAKPSALIEYRLEPHQYTLVRSYPPCGGSAEIDRGTAARTNDGGRAPLAVHIGGMSIARGWPQLLSAMARCRNTRLRVLLLGSVDEGTDAVMAAATRLGVASRVEIRPHLKYDEMLKVITGASVGLMLYQPGPLNHTHAFPLKLFDYLSCGLPMIGPKWASEVRDILVSSRCGVLVETGDPQEVADALDWVCEHPEEARAMGDRGREAVRTRLNWEGEVPKLLAIYERLLGGPAEAGLAATPIVEVP